MKKKIWSALLSSVSAGIFGYCMGSVFFTADKVWVLTVTSAVIGIFLSDSAWEKLSRLFVRVVSAVLHGILGYGLGLEIDPDGIVIPVILSIVAAIIGFIIGKHMKFSSRRF